MRWREYWDNQLTEHVRLYEKLGWKLICLDYDSKIPVKGVNWTRRSLTYENALILFKKKMNIGLNLFASKLIVAEIDGRIIPDLLKPFFRKTMTALTPRGYHIYFKYDTEIDGRMLPFKELWRGCPNKSQYTVLPLSHVSSEKHGYHMRYYEWLSKDRLMKFSDFSNCVGIDTNAH